VYILLIVVCPLLLFILAISITSCDVSWVVIQPDSATTVSMFHDKVVDALLFGGYAFSYIYDELSCYFDS
jgi:hypothetical protein